MNFQKYEREMKDFLNENYQNLKRVKIANSEFALKELLKTEQADINNYARSIVRKIISDVRKSFVAAYDAEKGYEIGEKYKLLVKAPEFNQIEVNFVKEVPMNEQVKSIETNQQTLKKQATQKFKLKSPANQYRARNLAIGSGTATAFIGLPTARLLMPATFGTSLLGIGFSAIVVAGIVYTFIKYWDESGHQQTSYVPLQEKQVNIQKTNSSATVKKTIDQASMSQLLELRKAEVQRVLLKTIQDAKEKYEQLQDQVQTV